MGKWVVLIGGPEFGIKTIKSMAFEGKIDVKDYDEKQFDVFFKDSYHLLPSLHPFPNRRGVYCDITPMAAVIAKNEAIFSCGKRRTPFHRKIGMVSQKRWKIPPIIGIWWAASNVCRRRIVS